MSLYLRFVCTVLLAITLNASEVFANDLNLKSGEPIQIQADQLYYEKNRNIAYALGHVEIFQGQQILLADHATFYREQDIIYLKGNVAIKREDGSVFFSDEARLEKTSKIGLALNFKARMAKNTLLAAKYAELIDDNTMEMEEMVVSPCKVCESNYRSFFPLWQFRSKKATLDKQAERIYYKDAKIDFLGVPVFYTPYISSPAPGAKRKSGVLFPEVNYSSSNTGFGLGVPYYWNIAPDKDATLTPMVTTKGGQLFFGEYRQKFRSGDVVLKGSVAHVQKTTKSGRKVEDKNTLKGHYDIVGDFDISNSWHKGKLQFKAKRIFDPAKTYLAKYKVSKEQILRTDVTYNVFEDRNYYIARALSFQDLRPNHNNKTTPIAVPLLEAHREKKLDIWNAKLITDMNVLNLLRNQGESYQRFSFSEGIKIPVKLPHGHQFNTILSVRGDGYNVQKTPIVVKDTQTKLFNNKEGTEGRIYPELRNEWSWPLYNFIGNNMLIVEPVAQLMVAPNMTNLDKVGNEDSLLPEISASNLFSHNRYVGFDKIESGTRMNYGIRGNLTFEKFKNINAIFGQTYRTHKDSNFDRKSGLDGHQSDYVGKLTVQPDEYVFFNDAFRIDSEEGKPLRNEFNMEVSYPTWTLNMVHMWIDNELVDSNTRKYRQEIGVTGTYNFFREWWIEGGISSRLGKKIAADSSRIVNTSSALRFQADCLYAKFVVSRDYTKTRDLKPENTYSFVITIPTY